MIWQEERVEETRPVFLPHADGWCWGSVSSWWALLLSEGFLETQQSDTIWGRLEPATASMA